jgi:Protein of unknown function, DUF488
MIYFSSYNNRLNHHGTLVAISLKQPFPTPLHLEFFQPTPGMLAAWKKGKQSQADWDAYCKSYWKLLKQPRREGLIHEWLNGLTSADEMTLLCYEADDTFCHRSLVAQIVQKYRPHIYGGRDEPLLAVGDRVKHRTVDKGIGTVHELFNAHATSVYVSWDSEPTGTAVSIKHPYKDQASTRIAQPTIFPANSLELVAATKRVGIKQAIITGDW